MWLTPGDILVMRWVGLDDAPVRGYLIIAMEADRNTYWYQHLGEAMIRWATIQTLEDAFQRKELELVTVIRHA